MWKLATRFREMSTKSRKQVASWWQKSSRPETQVMTTRYCDVNYSIMRQQLSWVSQRSSILHHADTRRRNRSAKSYFNTCESYSNTKFQCQAISFLNISLEKCHFIKILFGRLEIYWKTSTSKRRNHISSCERDQSWFWRLSQTMVEDYSARLDYRNWAFWNIKQHSESQLIGNEVNLFRS